MVELGRTAPPLRASSRDTTYVKSSPEKDGDIHVHVTTWSDVIMLKVRTSIRSGTKIFFVISYNIPFYARYFSPPFISFNKPKLHNNEWF